MATKTASEIIQSPSGRVRAWAWLNVTPSDVCAPLRIDDYDDLTISVHGTMDSSTWDLKISNYLSTVDTSGELVDYISASDALTGNAISLTLDNTGMLIAETGVYFQPQHDGGGTAGTMNVTVVLCAK